MYTHAGLMKNNNKNGKLLSKIKCPHKETCPDCGKNCPTHISFAYHFVHENCWLSEWVNTPAGKGIGKYKIPGVQRFAWSLLASRIFVSAIVLGPSKGESAVTRCSTNATKANLGVTLSPPLGSGERDLFPHEHTRFSRSKNHRLRSISKMPLIPLKQQVSLSFSFVHISDVLKPSLLKQMSNWNHVRLMVCFLRIEALLK